MNFIEKFEVTGFWGSHGFGAKLNSDVTFFIGPNGTGKTTLINLIAASLYCDFSSLIRLPFTSITLTLKSTESSQRSTITVQKKPVKNLTFDTIDYEIRAAGSNPIRFSLEDLEERVNLRYRDLPRRYVEDAYRSLYPGLPKKLSDLVSVCWLSIHRGPYVARGEEREFESSVDQRIAELSNGLVKYLSSLSRKKEDKVARLQEFIFLSLLSELEVGSLSRSYSKEATIRQQEAMAEIFRELHVSESIFDEKLRAFFAASEAIGKKSGRININDVENLASRSRLIKIIGEWEKYKNEIDSIYSNRNVFEEIVNDLFARKTLQFSNTNEILFETRSGKMLKPSMLSSGEKQMLILLGEALLQQGKPFVYIADEPELSLHVSWQEKLIDSILSLNRSAQIVAATHSPDIVGRRASNVIDMSRLIP